jgi:DNA-binding PadR family transcriptional regulator
MMEPERNEDAPKAVLRPGEATAERGGRAKKYYQIEGAGAEALRAMVARERLLKGVALRRVRLRV